MSEHVEQVDRTGAGFEKFFTVIARAETYLNIAYLLLSFPLGIFYFVYLVTGFSAGVPLVIIWIGIPVLIATLLLSYGISAFERNMTAHMLRVDIPPMRQGERPDGLLNQLKDLLTNPVTWKGIAYQLIKFPLGIVSFVFVIVGLTVPLSFIVAPIFVDYPGFYMDLGFEQIDTISEAAIISMVGAFGLFVSLHVLNALAWVHGQLARVMLGQHVVGTPAEPQTVERVEEPVVEPVAE